MFKRLAVADWMNDLSVIGFSIFFIAFVLAVIWALRLPRERIRRMESLPLESDPIHDEHPA